MGESHQIGVVTGRVDHHHVVAVLDGADSGREIGEFARLVGFDRRAIGALDAIMRRQLELDAPALGPGSAVLDVMSEALLPRVEIDGGDALVSWPLKTA
jgi:hypothetical protein